MNKNLRILLHFFAKRFLRWKPYLQLKGVIYDSQVYLKSLFRSTVVFFNFRAFDSDMYFSQTFIKPMFNEKKNHINMVINLTGKKNQNGKIS